MSHSGYVNGMSIEECAEEFAGNWQSFDSFGWNRQYDLESPEDWAIAYTSNRDSGLLAESNEEAINAILAPFTDGDDPDVVFESHSHWAVGHVDGFSIRVFRDGEITHAFCAWFEIMESLEDYPILDEEDYSAKEWDATMENLENEGNRIAGRHDYVLPDGWESQFVDWIDSSPEFRHDLESRDDQGGYPSEEALLAAFEALGFPRDGMRRCEDCNEWCADHATIPGPIDDGFWARESSDHASDCEWIQTRGRRV